ncbi:hypothetical protein CR513_43645, partial [Mucuna pruriens]
MAGKLGTDGHPQKSPRRGRHGKRKRLRLATRDMEQAIEDLKQQNLELRTEMGQIKEQINKMFELLTQSAALNAAVAAQGATLNTVAVTQGTPTHPLGFTPPHLNVHPYRMPIG